MRNVLFDDAAELGVRAGPPGGWLWLPDTAVEPKFEVELPAAGVEG